MTELDAACIEAAFERCGRTTRAPLTVLATTGSTNDDARQAAAQGAPTGSVFVADAQDSGRGRGAHRWHSPPGSNIYLSLVARPAIAPALMAPISLVVGVALAMTVDDLLGGPERAAIKWPNDVYVDARKLAGILVEASTRGDAPPELIIGVGLNVSLETFPDELAARATSLKRLGCEQLDRNEIVARLIHRIETQLSAYEGRGMPSILEQLGRRDFLRGRAVTVGEVSGTAAGIDEQGRLIIRDSEGQLQPLWSGEVNWR